jgi:hypothetical protein
MAYPRKWASTLNYTTGVDVGTPTRVDPGAGAAAEGAQPLGPLAAQHFNYLLGTVIQALYDAQEQPEEYAEIREDFTGATFDSTTDILHAAYPWQITSTENAVVGTDAATHPGSVTASLLATEEFEMELAGQQLNIRWGDLQDLTIIAQISSVDLDDAEMFVGLAENFELVATGNNAVGLWFKQTTSNNWMVRHKVAAVDDATLTSEPDTEGDWKRFKLHRISSTQVEAYIEGNLIATLTDGVDAPAASTLMTLGMLAKAGSAAAMTPMVDLFYVKWATPAR